MAAIEECMQVEYPVAEVYARTETFEKEQQRLFLTQLLAKPSSLYTHAAAAGLSPVAFRLECWKVRKSVFAGPLTLSSGADLATQPAAYCRTSF